MPAIRRSYRDHAWALAFYALVAVCFNWPLPARLGTHLTGPVNGDTGVYVWNIWLFRHELVSHGRFPLFTQEVLSLTPPTDLSLHNYTLFADLLALPLIPILGVVTTFNVVYLGVAVLSAWSMFLLARSVVGRSAEAWLAGLLFGFSPVLIARAAGHFSLTAAAPLPIFLLALRHAQRSSDLRYAALAGLAAAWAAMCDPYYGIFCALIAAGYLAAKYIRLRIRPTPPAAVWKGRRVVDVLLALDAVLIAGIVISGGGELRFFGQTLGLRSLHTPVLVMALLLILRLHLRHRPSVHLRLPQLRRAGRLTLVGAVTCGVMLSPLLYAFGFSLADGASLHGPIYWRSSPPGVDLLALFAPNPNHALFGAPWRSWLAQLPNGYVENVASLPIVAWIVLAVAVWRYRFRPPHVWVTLTLFLAALAVGPFMRVADVNTFVPGPWALLRYVPIVGATRTPTRYAIPLAMTFALLFALALRHIINRRPARRVAILALVGGALLFELMPFPRPVYAARVPDIYQTIADDPRDVVVLQLPFGFRSGEWSEGNFNPASQFYQTVHQKRLIGGYLSRISRREMERQHQSVTVRRLIQLSQNEELSPEAIDEMKQRAPAFLQRARVGYVVIDVVATPPLLKRVVIEAFGLKKIGENDNRELYVPTLTLTTAAAR